MRWLMLLIALSFCGCLLTSDQDALSLAQTSLQMESARIATCVQTDTRCTRTAVTAGLTKVIPSAWNGWGGACPGCDLDEARVRSYVDGSLAFGKRIRANDLQVTKYGLVAAALNAAQGLQRGDLLFISVSGHGGETDNADGDQGEKYDQYLCLADGPLKDDIIWQLLTKALSDVPGLRICLFFDTCNSRTMYRGVPYDYAGAVRSRMATARAVIDGGLIVISGCDDGKSSFGDAVTGGALTYAAFAKAPPKGNTWDSWFAAIAKAMPKNQKPFMSKAGVDFGGMEAMR